MPADDFGDRTQRPTERSRREARARGEVARSADLVAALVLLSAAVALGWLAPPLGNELAGLLRSSLSTVSTTSIDAQSVTQQIQQSALRLATPVSAILLVIIGAAVLSNLLQSGFLWVPTAVLPQWARLDPGKALRRWWTIPSWVGLCTSMLKLTVLLGGLVAYLQIRLTSAGPLIEGSPLAIYNLTARLLGELAIVLALLLLFLAILDYGYQFWRHETQLMMTIEEVRQEQREAQRDPELKRRQRASASAVSGPREVQ